MLGMVRYILYNVLTVLLYYIQMGQCNEKLLTRRKLVTGESFKVCVRLGHLEKGTSRLGTATGGNTQRHKPRADTFWGMLWAFGGWEFVGVVMGGGGTRDVGFMFKIKGP